MPTFYAPAAIVIFATASVANLIASFARIA
jgi:hypothetical protein